MSKMFELLKEGLKEAISYEKGLSQNVKAKKVRIDTIPKQPKRYKAANTKN